MDYNFKSVCIYSRRSRADETDADIKSQLNTCISICKKQGWNYDIVEEVASSQTISETARPAFQKLLNDVSDFKYDAVVASDIDRLGRHPAILSDVKSIFVTSGTLFVTPSKVYDFSLLDDDFTTDLLSVLSKAEYNKIKARLTRGLWNAATQGKWLGKPPYGYDKDSNHKLIPNKDAPVVKLIFELYVNRNYNTTEIALELSNMTGTKWLPRTIGKMLKQKAYIGTVVYGATIKQGNKRVARPIEQQVIIPYNHEPILQEEIFKLAQLKLEDSRILPPSARLHTHKYSSVFKCSKCGTTMAIQVKNGREYLKKCQGQYLKDGKWIPCDTKGASCSKLEKYVLADIKAQLALTEDFISSKQFIPTEKENLSQSLVDSYRGMLEKNKKKIYNIQDAMLEGILTKQEAKDKLRELRAEQESLEASVRRLEIEEGKNTLDKAKALRQALVEFLEGAEGWDDKTYNRILRGIINKIEYTRDEASKIAICIDYK